MPISFNEESNGTVLTVQVSGKLQNADYQAFVPAVERMIAEHGPLRMLLDMTDFHGWEASAAWEDLKFGVEHFADIERLAMVGEKEWQHVMALFCKPFTKAKVRYFDRAELSAARTWLEEA